MNAFSRVPQYETILDAKASTGVGNKMLVSDYKTILLDLFTASSANLTVKIQGSLQNPDNAPDFASAASSTNRWFYLGSYDLGAAAASSFVPGSTGYVASGSDFVKGVLVNTDGVVWLNLQVTARSAGSVSAKAILYNNQ